ncbi:class I SAM-dependent methyltransferase [Nannocystis sp. SCPEA4]|uniref:class I SAM-dependent methyltransferase n=1 Tax=Nannocystis sp. SCPEA4 TaxID=2996787 RepID=UPI002271896D|nr:class I SAM-dependent methyltransferase [Nannocystis sp. SCPEA4]MCY1061428.1 class I SAM-dependent methyltransferase [Nannocystis sp. SCPEA4]
MTSLASLPTLAAIARIPAEQLAAAVGVCLDAAAFPVLARLLDLDLLERLARGPATLAWLADEVADLATPVSLQMTAELACAFGLLALRDQRLELTPFARTFFLNNDSQVRLLGLVDRHRRYLAAIGALPAALRETRLADRRLWSDQADAREQAAYFKARGAFNEASRSYFWDTAALLARAHADRDLHSHRIVCDVGAGPAAFAAILKQAAPQLQVHAAEVNYADSDYLAATSAALQTLNISVELHAINVLHRSLPPDIDLLTANRLFSGLSREGAEGWARRLFAALAPGGTLALVDFFATGEPAHDRSLAALLSLWMAWNHHELTRDPPTDPRDDRHAWGWNSPWRCDELAALLARVGFRDVRSRSVVPPFALVEATRP